MNLKNMKGRTYENPPFARFIFDSTKLSILWLLARLYVGWIWLEAGLEKIGNPAWTGENAGAAVNGFVTGALQKTVGDHPDVQGWYAWFLENVVLSNTEIFGYFIAYGEFLVGIALILGIFTGIAAFFGGLMNLSFLLAGTVSVNPVLFTLSIFIILGWKVAGHIGLDRYLLPFLGTPWSPGFAFRK